MKKICMKNKQTSGPSVGSSQSSVEVNQAGEGTKPPARQFVNSEKPPHRVGHLPPNCSWWCAGRSGDDNLIKRVQTVLCKSAEKTQ